MNKKKLNDDQIKEITNRYLQGEMVADLKREFNCSDKTIYNCLRLTNNIKHGFDIRYATVEQKEQIKELYLSGVSSPKIGKMFGCTHKPILAILEEFGIERDQKKLVRKYKLNEHYFDVIDTPNKAYILGLLHADGCNMMNKSTICIGLQESDKDLLERVRLEIGSEKPLIFKDYSNKHTFGYNYENMYELKMFSKYMCEQLADKGIVPNKSLVIGFPDWLDKDLISHYIRGVFDGDGSICKSGNSIHMNIVGTDTFCKTLKQICNEVLDINPSIHDASCHNGITKQFTINSKAKIKKFLDWIYKDADIYLQRKYDRYCNYFNINDSLTA